MRQGRGVYDDGAKQRYEGEWLNDMMHGRGTFEYASGAKYEGEFVANKYDGYGTFIFSTGAKYEGHFKDNQFHGAGTFTDAQHVEWKGKFYNGTGTRAAAARLPVACRVARSMPPAARRSRALAARFPCRSRSEQWVGGGALERRASTGSHGRLGSPSVRDAGRCAST